MLAATAMVTDSNDVSGNGDSGNDDVNNGGSSGDTTMAAMMAVIAVSTTTAAAAAAAAAVAVAVAAAAATAAAASAAAAAMANYTARRRRGRLRRRIFNPTLTWYMTRVCFYLTQKNLLKCFRLSHPGTLAGSYPPVYGTYEYLLKEVKPDDFGSS